MSSILAVLAALMLAGCTSLQQVPGEPAELRAQIRAGALVDPGDRIAVTTVDGNRYAFEVTRITAETIAGEGVEVPIDRIAALRMERFDAGRTAGAAGGAVFSAYVAAAVAAFLSVLAALE